MAVHLYNKSGAALASTLIGSNNLVEAFRDGQVQIPVLNIRNEIIADINSQTLTYTIPTLITFTYSDNTKASVQIPIRLNRPESAPITYRDVQSKQFVGETFLGEYTKNPSAVSNGNFTATKTAVAFPLHNAHGI